MKSIEAGSCMYREFHGAPFPADDLQVLYGDGEPGEFPDLEDEEE